MAGKLKLVDRPMAGKLKSDNCPSSLSGKLKIYDCPMDSIFHNSAQMMKKTKKTYGFPLKIMKNS